MSELAKCRCGGEGKLVYDGFRTDPDDLSCWEVVCKDCERRTGLGWTKSEAPLAWNRMQNPDDTFVAGVEACRELAERMQTDDPRNMNKTWRESGNDALVDFQEMAKELR